ncbi:uncharacterized protein LOC123549046 [Mercenaria mercenaria]|uniref:uncharacterized protein LOC123549046 n=1 Tax=Mercenaria mercenaria TaxID=6596 RepID=UPI00234F8E9F|nr:uncharacterized protein LOC123549046 [Mercenaria mercenaria]
METTVVNSTRAIRHKRKSLIIGILLFALNGACDGYDMENYCGEEFSFILKDEYQIKFDLDDMYIYDNADDYTYRRGYCETKFEAWYTTYSKLMFYFEDLDLDCDKGHLEFYTDDSGYIRVPGLESDICGYDKPHGVFTVDTRYFRIKYVPKSSQYISDIFSIIITIYGDGYCPSYAHECANSRCIDDDLACNGYDSCGDGSGCDLGTGAIVGIVIGSLTGLALIVSVVICCICCTRRSGQTPGVVQNTANPAVTLAPNQQLYSQPMYGVNQGSPYNPSQFPYPLATATPSNQPGYSHPIYDVNQGTQYPTNQTNYPIMSPNSETNQQPTDEKQYSAPPPQYSEIFANSEQDTNQTMH